MPDSRYLCRADYKCHKCPENAQNALKMPLVQNAVFKGIYRAFIGHLLGIYRPSWAFIGHFDI